MAALRDLGEKQAWKHIIVVRENAQNLAGWGAQDTVMVFRKPIRDDDLERARSALAETKLQLVYLPGDTPTNEFGQFLNSPNPEAFWSDYAFNISPVDDDRPFFFYTVQPRDLLNFLTQSARAADYKINRAVPLLFELLGVSLLATIVVLALPPLVLGSRLKAEHGVRSSLLYFIFIGAGYVLIQVALIQKFVLFLGHPTYALTVIIFSMLISSGVGSFFSRRLVGKASDSRLSTVLLAVAAAVSALAFLASPISESGVGWPLGLKIAVTVGLVAPAGFLMGMPFPIGLARLGALYPRAVRWAWALNAAASVLGSAAAIFFAIYLGLRATVLLGAALYLGALAVVWLRQPAAVVVAPAGAELRA
jgi:hypothetical protein